MYIRERNEERLGEVGNGIQCARRALQTWEKNQIARSQSSIGLNIGQVFAKFRHRIPRKGIKYV